MYSLVVILTIGEAGEAEAEAECVACQRPSWHRGDPTQGFPDSQLSSFSHYAAPALIRHNCHGRHVFPGFAYLLVKAQSYRGAKTEDRLFITILAAEEASISSVQFSACFDCRH